MNSKRNRKVLIVEDEPDLRQIIKEVFVFFGWQVTEVENGQKGLEELLRTRYDFVISDIRMPVATGIDMLEQLPPELKKQTSIIMMSAYSDQSERSVQRLGATRLIPKPMSMSRLVQEVTAITQNLRNAA